LEVNFLLIFCLFVICNTDLCCVCCLSIFLFFV
jgi:hypothetical protein